MLFLVVVTIFPPAVKTALLFQHRSRTPKFHHLLWHLSGSFLSAFEQSNSSWLTDMVLFFVHLSADAAQILWQCNTSLVCWSKSAGTIFYRFLLLWQLHGQLGDDFDDHSKRFLNMIIVHWRGRPPRFGVIFDGRSAQSETLVPCMTLRMAQTILSISLLQHLKSLCKSSSQFETEFDANVLLLKILHFSTCKKSPRVLNTHSFKCM